MNRLCVHSLIVSVALAWLICSTVDCGRAWNARSELKQQQERWRASGVTDYRYTIKWYIGGQAHDVGKPVVIEVRDGKRTSMTCAGCEIERPEIFDDLDTVEKLFERIEKGILSEPAEFRAKYDETLGYPVNYGKKQNGQGVMDDWEEFEVLNFERVK